MEFNPLDRVKNALLHDAAEYWNRLRGSRRFPERKELNPGSFRSALRYMALVRVIGRGADFEYRIVGDTLARAFGVSLNSRKLSAIAAEAPSTAAAIGRIYGHGATTGEAFVVHGTIGRSSEAARFMRLEALVLPLGADGVDHLLTFMVFDAAEFAGGCGVLTARH